MASDIVEQASWTEVIKPLAAKFTTAWLSDGDAVWNAEGAEAMSKLLTQMAEKLDNGDDYFVPRPQFLELESKLAEADAFKRRLVEAWEALPGGRHYTGHDGIKQVERWLADHMAVVVKEARQALRARKDNPNG